jgi:PAS domain S-box-containing protein
MNPTADKNLILIVEDSLTQATRLQFSLEEQGFAVHHARNGLAALDALARRRPLAVISDVNMPLMDGYDLCRRVRANESLRDLPLLLLTSLSESDDVMLALECGADYFFTKPFNQTILFTRLRYIQDNPQLHQSRLQAYPIEVHVGGRHHQFSTSHFRIFNLLLSTYESAVAQNQRLQEAEAKLRQVNEELDARVRARTDELTRANEALQAENTARRQMEERLREQAELLDKSNEAIITADLDKRIQFWNRGAERMLGLTAAQMLGSPLDKVLAGGGSAVPGQPSEPFVSTADWRGELRGQRQGGSVLRIESGVTVLRTTAGTPTGWLIICTDVTEQKVLEEKFLRAQRLEGLGMLAAGIAHDLNNMLAPVGLAAGILRQQLFAAADIKLLNILENSVDRGSGLVRQILGFAQGVSGELRIVQAKHLLSEMVSIIRQTFPKSITLVDKVSGNLWPISGQPTQIHQVLLNLCVNARDSMPEGGVLRLGAENCILDEAAAQAIPGARAGKWLVLEVADSGSGIPPEILARIWDPFFTTKPTGKGSGLGLATVRGIMATHHGFITLESTLGRGTRFQAYFPAAEREPDPTSPLSVSDSHRGRGELIVVVDDEEPNREMTQSVLISNGYQVETAGDGAAGLVVINQRARDVRLVITDYDMPVLNGAGLISRLQAEHPQIKIILLSGDERSLKNIGVDRLEKPCSGAALLNKVDQLMHEGQPSVKPGQQLIG